MGRMKKLYQAKRFLALVLAVAMAVTMVPTTAYAATPGEDAQETVTDSNAEPKTADGTDGDVAGEESDEPTDDAVTTIVNEETPKESGDDGTPDDLDKEVTGESVPATGEDAGTDGENSLETGDKEPKADETGAAEAAKPTFAIVADELETTAEYSGSAAFDLSGVKLKKTQNGKTEDASAEDLAKVTHVWQAKGADGNYAAMAAGAEPTDAGSYRAVFSFAKEEGVHDGAADVTVDFEITQAAVSIDVGTVAVTPGTVKEAVKAEVSDVDAAGGNLSAEDIVLTITDVRDAFAGTSVAAGAKLVKDGDYVLDITPSFKADADAAKKAVYANYKLEPFTADVVMGELIETSIKVTLAEKWKEDEAVTKVYDGAAAAAPVKDTDYTIEAQYRNEKGELVKFETIKDAEITGEWKKYSDDCFDEAGKVVAPTDAGEYTYILTYKNEAGDYAESTYEIPVKIKQAQVIVEITNSNKELTFPADTALYKVLNEVNYSASALDNAGAKKTINVKTNHIWGTGYNDSNVTQIYEPLFTLQEKVGTTYKSIDDADYKLESGKEYRIIFDGKKAIYNADGTYGHRTDINAKVDGNNREEINGVDGNYITDTTPTADDQAIIVKTLEGTKAEFNIDSLLADKKAGATPETAGAKDYDGKTVYSSRSDYKNKVKLKAGSKSFDAVGEEFTYTWYRNTAYDLIDIQIKNENKANGFKDEADFDIETDENWSRINAPAGPQDAGVYKLEINYEDKTDDGAFYYVEKPAVVYYVINRAKIAVTPKGEYNVLSGRTIADFFHENELTEEDYEVTGILQGHTTEVEWLVNERIETEDPQKPEENTYYEGDYRNSFKAEDEKAAYTLQADTVVVENGSGYDETSNYTCYDAKVGHDDADKSESGQPRAIRDDGDPLHKTAPIKVTKMGTTALTVTVDSTKWTWQDKVFDGKALKVEEVITAGLVNIAKKEGGEAVADPGLEYRCETTDGSYTSMLEDTREAGEYDVYACFGGNETYAPIEDVRVGTLRIAKRPITLKADVQDTYVAGVTPQEVLRDVKVTAEGYVTDEISGGEWDDEWAFTADEGSSSILAWENGPKFRIYEKGGKTAKGNTENLRREKTFEVCYNPDLNSLKDYYRGDDWDWDDYRDFDRNYEVTTALRPALDEFTTVAGNSTIESVRLENYKNEVVEKLAIKDVIASSDSMKHEVSILEGIGYSQYTLEDGTTVKGNLAAFAITAPREYGNVMPETAMYENEVKENKGYVVEEGYSSFTVLFDARDAVNGAITFNVRWEDKYVETFVLNIRDNQLLGNLENAVMPKSLAFNAAEKKMTVGSSQQLDVKITKAQMSDIISLGYESSDEQILVVNENGYVTALKKGKATITAYPQEMDSNGKVVRIDGAKVATMQIEATAMTAPKTVKVSAHGTYADINYDVVKDGYRREIYVVDNEKNATLKKAADIEDAVKAMKNDQWKGTFAIAPIYLDSADESLNRSKNKYTARLNGLKTTGQYTVYVRNVCAARTLADGNAITQDAVNESAAGTAVSFKTLKSELVDLHLTMNDDPEGITDLTEDWWFNDPDYRGHIYKVDFSKVASVDSIAFGEFLSNVKDPAADKYDTHYIQVPFPNKDDKNDYEEPKLEYTLEDCWNKKTGRWEYGQKNDYASIDKKGKIKLTGVTGEDETVWVRVRDTVTGETAYAGLNIVADVDSITAKKKSINLPVGQEINLNDISLYTYAVGRKKLTGYWEPDIRIDDALKAAVEAKKDYFELNGSWLRAINADKVNGTLTLSLTDRTVEKNTDKQTATVEITFKATELAAVKKLKAYDVTHNRFGLTFTAVEGFDAVRLEIADSSGKKIVDKRCANWNMVDGVKDPKTDRYIKDAYMIDPWTIEELVTVNGKNRLAKESQYTVTVTALYEDVASKPATTKVKTTKIPAQDWYLEDEYVYQYDDNWNVIGYTVRKPKGGMSIQVSNGNAGYLSENDRTTLNVLSGNSYTLTAEIQDNRGRVNDTLVWTVGDSKVASVKAAGGSYCITLKGLKPGRTLLEIKSKLLGNKVVARYDINVVAVGDAYKNANRYYGDNEQEEWQDTWNNNNVNTAPAYLPLSVDDMRKVTNGSDAYFSFTAPETGKYTVYSEEGDNVSLAKRTNGSGWQTVYQYNENNLGWLQKGDTVYLRSNCDWADWQTGSSISYYIGVKLTGAIESLEVNGDVKVTGQGKDVYFKFTAPENAYYQFTAAYGQNQNASLKLYANEQDVINGDYNTYDSIIDRLMTKGDSVWLSAYLYSGREYTFSAKKISEDASFSAPQPVTLEAGGTKYLMYTVEKDGYYQFVSTADSAGSVNVQMLVNGEYVTGASSSVFTLKRELKQGDAVCLKVENTDSAAVSFTIATEDKTPADIPAAATTLAAGDTFYKFTATEAGAYKFSVAVDAASAANVELKIWDSMSDVDDYYGRPLATAENTVGIFLEAGQTVYVNPVNNSGSELSATISGAKDAMPAVEAGKDASVELTAGQISRVTFTASEAGIYTFTTGELSENVTFSLYNNDAYMAADSSPAWNTTVYSTNSLNKKLLLRAGQVIVWTIEADNATTVSLGAALADELKTGVPSTASVESGTADGFIFKAPEAGYYTFWSKGRIDTYGILYDINNVDADTCFKHSTSAGSNALGYDDQGGGDSDFAIQCELQKGQTVYLKVMYYFGNGTYSFPVYVEAGKITSFN